MKIPKQVVMIRGGEPYCEETAYRASLEEREVDIERFRQHIDWKGNMQSTLGPEYDVLMPAMPCSDNAQYDLWKLWFEKCLSVFDDSLTLVGHSLGAIFLAKYLSENTIPKKIHGLFLVAAPFDDDSRGGLPVPWGLSTSLRGIQEQTGALWLYHSKDDPVVPYAELQKYIDLLPSATVRTFEDAGHFNAEKLPEIVEDILTIEY